MVRERKGKVGGLNIYQSAFLCQSEQFLMLEPVFFTQWFSRREFNLMEPLSFPQKHFCELILICKHDFDETPCVKHEKDVLDSRTLRLVHVIDNLSIVPSTVGSECTALWSHHETESCERIAS